MQHCKLTILQFKKIVKAADRKIRVDMAATWVSGALVSSVLLLYHPECAVSWFKIAVRVPALIHTLQLARRRKGVGKRTLPPF